MNRCVIIGGAEIGDYSRISRSLRRDDFCICCDSGLRHAEKLGMTPSLIVGDFDSSERPDTDIETIVLPREKDDTDTVYAAKEAVRRGFDDFLLIGVTGARFDHTFGNISLLLWLEHQRDGAGYFNPRRQIPAGRSGDHQRVSIRNQQRGDSGREGDGFCREGQAVAGEGVWRRMNGYVCSFVVQHLDVERVSYYDVRAMKETQ